MLRALRNERGWTVEQLAERLLCSPSKVSRMETGQRGVSARDIRDLASIYDLDDARREQLAELAAEGKQPAWWQSRGLIYPTYIGLEAAASSISDFALGLVPGLLQTREYATAVLRAQLLPFTQDVLERTLETRLARQERLTSPSDPLRFEALLEASVLHRIAGGKAVMKAQLEQLLKMSERPNFTIRVLPFEAGVLPSNTNKFIILTFDKPEVPSTVFIEALTGDLYIDRPDEVAVYQEAFSVMQRMAANEAESRDIIASLAGRLTKGSQR
jgi:transcriptional regulator with XRE-family HTH domain